MSLMSRSSLRRNLPILVSLLTLAAPALLALPAAAQAEPAAEAQKVPSFDDFFGADDERGGRPSYTWSPNGETLSYLWSEGEDEQALWLLDPSTGKSRAVLRAGEDGAPSSFEGHAWATDGQSLLLWAEGDLYAFRPGGKLRRLTETEAEEEDPKLSPDGSRVAFVQGFDLHVLDVASGEVRALTSDGEANVILNGKTDWVYWEEIWSRNSTGHWWSPQGDRIAYYRFEEEPVRTYALVDFTPKYPEVENQKYPKAGEANPRVRVGVVPAAGGETVWMETGDPQENYLTRVYWTPDGSRLALERLNRDQNRLELLLCAPETGSCQTLLTDESKTWVNVERDTHLLADGRVLWLSQREGWTHLYLFDAEGKLIRRLSPDGVNVDEVAAVHEGAVQEDGEGDPGWVVYTAYSTGELGAKDRRVEKVALTGGDPVVLAGEEGWNGADVAPATGHWVHSFSSHEAPSRLTVRRAGGEAVTELPGGTAESEANAQLPRWRYLTIPGPDGQRLPARILEPVGRTAGERHPVIMYHYGGPESQVVSNNWGGGSRNRWFPFMASRGYVVFMVDNAASNFFGKKGADRVHRRFGEVNLAAQLAAVDYLKTLDFVDPERIGLWGWSGGGSNTLYCVLNRPGVWKAAVAGAPVTDWRLYDAIWTERYLDHPEDNPDGYRDSSAITYAANLKDALLIVHGTADDNVHPQNTLVMSKEFIDAGVPFEQAIYPRQKHGFQRQPYLHFLRRMTEFFDRHLMAKE